MADQTPGEVIVPVDHDSQEQPTTQQVEPTQDTIPKQPETPAEPTQIAPVEPIPTAPTNVPEYALFNESISWNATNTAQSKDSAWYGFLVLGSMIISGIIFLLNRDFVTSGILLFALIGLGYFLGHQSQAHEQTYAVDINGIAVGRSYYAFHEFQSFSISQEAASSNIVLTPLKRFMPAVTLLVPEEYEEKVTQFISNILPLEPHKTDFVETLMRRLKL